MTGGMNCIQARRILILHEPLDDMEPATEHVSGCADCLAFFQQEEKTARLTQNAASRPAPPASLRESILSRLSHISGRKRLIGRRTAYALTGSLAAAALVVISLLLWPGSDEHKSVVAALTQHHAMTVHAPDRIQSGSDEEVRGWLRGRVDFSVVVPHLDGGRLRGAAISVMAGRRAAVLNMELDGVSATVYVLKDERVDLSGLPTVERKGNILCTAGNHGCNLVVWKRAGLVYAVVADLDLPKLMAFVDAVADQV